MDAMRILVVEDDRPVADFISKGLEATGFAVDSVDNGAEALRYGLTYTYDAAVVELTRHLPAWVYVYVPPGPRLKSYPPAPGRPPIPLELQALIRRIASENSLVARNAQSIRRGLTPRST
jgi:hypothetical protein